ncbi:MAG TPA: UbiA family prenyltransferase [Flavisolibacter sp.]|nr:UbiA family prenyltransferase [Flavisolibacter sp.]
MNWKRAALIFFILHILVYPSSNGYNSFMDRDVTPIGGLRSPLQPTMQLFFVTIVMDLLALILSLYISIPFMMGIMLYILASRAYSYRGIRLKRLPVAGFLTVFLFQGALIFFITWHGSHIHQSLDVPLIPCIISSLLIGALYPLTQVYQHEDDKKDGVITLSYTLGKKGSFVFSMMLFLAATAMMYILLTPQPNQFYLFLLVMLPVVLFFLYWMKKVWSNNSEANYKNSLLMNAIATLCTTVFFLTLIILNH